MSNICPLPGKQLSAGQTGREPNTRTIAVLESLLARARSGDMQVIAYAAINHDGGTLHGWTTRTAHDATLAIGTLVVCQTDIARQLWDGDPE